MVNTMSATGTQQPATRTGEVAIRTHGLTKQYGERLAVNDLNLEVYRGDIFGFLGPNGAGKTTTIRMMLHLITPTSGSIEVLGHDVATSSAEILPRVGALVETPALYLYMSGTRQSARGRLGAGRRARVAHRRGAGTGAAEGAR